ncbi:hypothetical protein ABZ807_32370 [Micromonospora sp. NPDC047548]|uniref:hypothetical protein n=1 Tax=Micromonospora sp. NPDC047548 TaxID=3155624 RepID=UPI0033D96976
MTDDVDAADVAFGGGYHHSAIAQGVPVVPAADPEIPPEEEDRDAQRQDQRALDEALHLPAVV